jgi:hypothetical protein
MTPVVLDTDIVSFLFKSDSRAEAYLPHTGLSRAVRDRSFFSRSGSEMGRSHGGSP